MSVHSTGRQFIWLETNYDLDANPEKRSIFKISGVSNAVKRANILLEVDFKRGTIAKVIAEIIAKTGTKPDSIELAILDVDEAVVGVGQPPVESGHTTYFSEGNPIASGSGRELVINDMPPNPVPIHIRGTQNTVQVTVNLPGADGTTNYDIDIQIVFEKHDRS